MIIKKSSYFITAIGTEVGKTITSAILTKALDAKYWKPIQCGNLDQSDSIKIQQLTGMTTHPERYILTHPMSPHAAAAREGVEIRLPDFELPEHDNHTLIVEGAGGLQVPLNQDDLMSDLIEYLNIPLILVIRHYLGSINHSLLSIELIRRRKLPFAGVIYIGKTNLESEQIITRHLGKNKVLGHLPELLKINARTIAQTAELPWIQKLK